MHEFRIEPHIGIGPVRLDASRSAVQEALSAIGFPLENTHDPIDYFCGAAIQIEYSAQQRARFVGFSCHEAYSLFYCGLNVFDTPAQDLFAFIAERDDSGPHVFRDTDYFFPNQILNLWEADSQYDRLGGEQRVVWAQIGLGSSEYLEAIRQLNVRNAI